MTQNSTRRNRHRIPIMDDPPKRCIWHRCDTEVASGLLYVPLCYEHATFVHDEVEAHADRVSLIVERRRERFMAEQLAARGLQPYVPPKPEPKPEIIYYLQVGGHIKIGWTSDLGKRMRSYPPNTELLAIHPGRRADERALHKRFAVHRSHGQEWYPLVPVLLDHIKRVIAEHGQPPAMTFGAKPVTVPTPHRARSTLGAKYGPMMIN